MSLKNNENNDLSLMDETQQILEDDNVETMETDRIEPLTPEPTDTNIIIKKEEVENKENKDPTSNKPVKKEEMFFAKIDYLKDENDSNLSIKDIFNEEFIVSENFYDLKFYQKDFGESRVRFYIDNIQRFEFHTPTGLMIEITDKLYVFDFETNRLTERSPFHDCFELEIDLEGQNELERVFKHISTFHSDYFEQYISSEIICSGLRRKKKKILTRESMKEEIKS